MEMIFIIGMAKIEDDSDLISYRYSDENVKSIKIKYRLNQGGKIQ